MRQTLLATIICIHVSRITYKIVMKTPYRQIVLYQEFFYMSLVREGPLRETAIRIK